MLITFSDIYLNRIIYKIIFVQTFLLNVYVFFFFFKMSIRKNLFIALNENRGKL